MLPTIDLKETGMNLRKIMDKRGITVKDVRKYLGLGSVQSVYHWLNGISMPTIDNLYALSELFQVPVDTMICGTRKRIQPEIIVEITNASTQRMYAYYKRLHPFFAA